MSEPTTITLLVEDPESGELVSTQRQATPFLLGLLPLAAKYGATLPLVDYDSGVEFEARLDERPSSLRALSYSVREAGLAHEVDGEVQHFVGAGAHATGRAVGLDALGLTFGQYYTHTAAS